MAFRRSRRVDDTYFTSGIGSSSFLEEKTLRLEAILSHPTVNLWELRELALSEGGLVNDSIRQRAWPALVGLHTKAVQVDRNDNFDTTSTSPRCDVNQVELDVARCTWHLLTGSQRVQKLQMEHKRNKRIAKVIRKKQRRLAGCIERALDASNRGFMTLHYYQGYHDVACIFVATLRDAAPPKSWLISHNNLIRSLDLPSAVLLQVSQSHLVDCMQETFEPLQTSLTLTIFPLLALLDQEVHEHLVACDMAPFFALPWVLTWFAHEIRDTSLVKRMFDAFIGSHPALPFYVCVAMLLHPYNRAKILDAECDFASLHHILCELPKNSSSFGWRYQPGEGYVSDHEDDVSTATTTTTGGYEDDSDSIRTIEDSDSINTRGGTEDGEMVLLQAGILDDQYHEHGFSIMEAASVSTTMSTAQGTSSDDGYKQQVPFQELLDLAIGFMHRIPPRRLLSLARKYHGADKVEELLMDSPSGTWPVVLQDPPFWALSPTAPAEWWLKSKVREARGLTPRGPRTKQIYLQQLLNRKTAGKLSRQSYDLPNGISVSSEYVDIAPRKQLKVLRQLRGRIAPVASGMALSIKEEHRVRNRQRMRLYLVSFLVLVLAWQMAKSSVASPKHPAQGRESLQASFNQQLLEGREAPPVSDTSNEDAVEVLYNSVAGNEVVYYQETPQKRQTEAVYVKKDTDAMDHETVHVEPSCAREFFSEEQPEAEAVYVDKGADAMDHDTAYEEVSCTGEFFSEGEGDTVDKYVKNDADGIDQDTFHEDSSCDEEFFSEGETPDASAFGEMEASYYPGELDEVGYQEESQLPADTFYTDAPEVGDGAASSKEVLYVPYTVETTMQELSDSKSMDEVVVHQEPHHVADAETPPESC